MDLCWRNLAGKMEEKYKVEERKRRSLQRKRLTA